MTDLADLNITEAGNGLRAGDFTAGDLLDAVTRRSAVTETHLHAYLTLDHEGASEAAETADAAFAAGDDAGPLQGIPIALKDNMCTKGVDTTAASQILAGWAPPYDATVVSRLRDAGAVITGKTNLDEFAMGSSTENSAFGTTRNPWDTDRVPGGSSGGSAATVAAGSAFGAFGSDTGGSIRQPAALTGVVGMKPTYGLVSRYGLIAFASSLDQIGPFSRSVEDSVVLLDAIAGWDRFDSTSIDGPVPNLGGSLTKGVDGLRIGLVKELVGDGIDPDVLAATRAMADKLESAGASVAEASLPSSEYALSAYYLIAPAECSSNLARFDGVRYGHRSDVEGNTEEMMSHSRAEGFGPEVIRRILLGTYALSAGYYDAFYGQAQRVRTLVRHDFAAAYAAFDVLISPTSPTTAFKVGERAQDPIAMYYSDVCTIPSNLSGDPSISLPVGLDSEGLPIGFQIMAPALGEEVMYQVAAEVERLAGFTERAALATSEVTTP
jgi:aspartyl-tRNA(Asn)/glutamyl-tRNA(Gln) amidotransferase subunit A